tara:strand:- start:118 stop:654 length:537 start_codon:yes stop_codon:yes gene_type:complete
MMDEDRRNNEYLAQFGKDIKLLIESYGKDHKQELAQHTTNNDIKMQHIVDGLNRNGEILTELIEGQTESATNIKGIHRDIGEIKSKQDISSGEIIRINAKIDHSIEKDKEQDDKIAALSAPNQKNQATGWAALLGSKPFPYALSLALVLFVIGMFQLLNVDPVEATGGLIDKIKLSKE